MDTRNKFIEVLGEPMGKQRPRASFIAGHATIYTPKKTQSYEGRFAMAYGEKYGDYITTAPLKVTIEAVFAINKGDYKKDGSPTKKGTEKLQGIIACTKRPDCDNIAKAVLDGLNGVAFVDDSQVIELTIRKRYATQPRVTCEIEEFPL